MVTFTLFRNKLARKGETITRPWSEWVPIFLKHDHRGTSFDTSDKDALDRAKDGPALILGEVKGVRSKTNVVGVHALALDIEDRPEAEVNQALQILDQFEWVAWTTHKHGSKVAGNTPRLRVLIPLAAPIDPADFPDAWIALDRMVGRINDPSTKDIGRLHFLPSTFDPAVAEAFHHPGQLLTLADLPDENAPDLFGVIDMAALTSIRNKLRRVRKDDELKPIAVALLDGKPLAIQGFRHRARLGATMWLALTDPLCTRDTFDGLFKPSADAMLALDRTDETLEQTWDMYTGALSRLETQRKKVQAAGVGPYTPVDLKRIADVNGWTQEELSRRWVIMNSGLAWFLTRSGDYIGGVMSVDHSLAVNQYLRRSPVTIIELTKQGKRARPIAEIFNDCATRAVSTVCDLSAQRTSYDPETEILTEAVLPIRDLEPVYNQQIDEWLVKLAGTEPLYWKMLDWMSCTPDLSKMLCAIYFDGAPSSGKTLFAFGMARLWTDGPPADIEEVIGNFNEELTRCPMVMADEEIPKRWQTSATAFLRTMLSTTSRTLKRKFKPPVALKGAVRLIMSANNEFLLNSSDVSSHQDLDAIAQRFLYVQVPKTSTEYLSGISRETKEMWATTGIAQHALYLQQNHTVKEPGKRFWVEGDVSQMKSFLMTGSYWNGLVCEWLVRYLMDPELFDSKDTGLIRIEPDHFLVNEQALIDGWGLYLHTKEEPKTHKIGAALRAIAKTKTRRQLRWKGRQIRYRSIDLDGLVGWAERYNIGDPKEIAEVLETRQGAIQEGDCS